MWPGIGTILRATLATTVAIIVGTRWTTSGAMVFVELAVLSTLVIVVLMATGELTPRERELVLSVLRRGRPDTR
jgi:hypothetical protein